MMELELFAGVVLASVVLMLVLEPLVRGRPWPAVSVENLNDPDFDLTDIEESESTKIQALLALREIEFDKETGKLSDEDYVILKSRYQQAALRAIEIEESGSVGGEVSILADEAPSGANQDWDRPVGGQLVCPKCGPRPESTARFCSDCGATLVFGEGQKRCPACGESVSVGAKFCGECGTGL